MTQLTYTPVYEVTRGSIVESVHFGAAAVVDSHGELLAHTGDAMLTTFLRSSAKPFQALPLIEHGGQQAYQLTPKEIALICASHKGTDEHFAAVSGLQAKTGVKESYLLCGTHPLTDKATVTAMRERGEEVTPNRHNCSGKHTGMLAYANLKKLPLTPTEDIPAYTDPNHPVQREILSVFSEMCAVPEDKVVLGVDGCSVPNFAVPLYNAAYGFARLCDPWELDSHRAEACRTITASMTTHPFMVSGPNGFDTAVMEAAGGKIVSKGGAEGFLIMGVMPGVLGKDSPGLGIAIKISDGDLGSRPQPDGVPFYARPAIGLEILRQLGVLSTSELEAVKDFGPEFTVYNWQKIKAGVGRPSFKLEKP